MTGRALGGPWQGWKQGRGQQAWLGEQCCFGDLPSSGCHVPGPLHLGDLASPGINAWPLLRDDDLQEQFRRLQRLCVCVFNDQRINHIFKNFVAFGLLVPQPRIEPVPLAGSTVSQPLDHPGKSTMNCLILSELYIREQTKQFCICNLNIKKWK